MSKKDKSILGSIFKGTVDLTASTLKFAYDVTEEIAKAELIRAKLYNDTAEFFNKCDLFICPTVMVPPFDVEIRYLDEVEGVKFDDYITWLYYTHSLTLTSSPKYFFEKCSITPFKSEKLTFLSTYKPSI